MRKIIRPLFIFALLLYGAMVSAAPGVYDSEVRYSSYGIPHIKADNYAGLGYGYGSYYASHNICILAREVLPNK